MIDGETKSFFLIGYYTVTYNALVWLERVWSKYVKNKHKTYNAIQ